MRCYLDTNCVRQIRRFDCFGEHDFFTSALAVFEIISGINSEEEYTKRKNILKTLQDSSLNILWDLPRTVVLKAFGLTSDDMDVIATKNMMVKIINSSDYEEVLELKLNFGGEDYTIENFINHDDAINETIKQSINDGISKVAKKERKKMKDVEMFHLEIEERKESLIHELLHDCFNNSDYYEECLRKYREEKQLENFLIFNILRAYQALVKGLTAGSNDGMDYNHIIFTYNIDLFISDDKFFTKTPESISKYLSFKFMSYSDFCAEFSIATVKHEL